MRNITCSLLILFVFTTGLYSQNCTSNTEYATYPATNTGIVETINNSVAPGEYITVSNILENEYIQKSAPGRLCTFEQKYGITFKY